MQSVLKKPSIGWVLLIRGQDCSGFFRFLINLYFFSSLYSVNLRLSSLYPRLLVKIMCQIEECIENAAISHIGVALSIAMI